VARSSLMAIVALAVAGDHDDDLERAAGLYRTVDRQMSQQESANPATGHGYGSRLCYNVEHVSSRNTGLEAERLCSGCGSGGGRTGDHYGSWPSRRPDGASACKPSRSPDRS